VQEGDRFDHRVRAQNAARRAAAPARPLPEGARARRFRAARSVRPVPSRGRPATFHGLRRNRPPAASAQVPYRCASHRRPWPEGGRCRRTSNGSARRSARRRAAPERGLRPKTARSRALLRTRPTATARAPAQAPAGCGCLCCTSTFARQQVVEDAQRSGVAAAQHRRRGDPLAVHREGGNAVDLVRVHGRRGFLHLRAHRGRAEGLDEARAVDAVARDEVGHPVARLEVELLEVNRGIDAFGQFVCLAEHFERVVELLKRRAGDVDSAERNVGGLPLQPLAQDRLHRVAERTRVPEELEHLELAGGGGALRWLDGAVLEALFGHRDLPGCATGSERRGARCERLQKTPDGRIDRLVHGCWRLLRPDKF